MTDTFDLTQARQLAAECAARAEKATPGPWHVYSGDATEWFVTPTGGTGEICQMQDRGNNRNTTHFIAAARQDVPVLAAALAAACDEVERATAERDAARAALSDLFEACRMADLAEELSDIVDGSLLDAALAALRQARGEEQD